MHFFLEAEANQLRAKKKYQEVFFLLFFLEEILFEIDSLQIALSLAKAIW